MKKIVQAIVKFGKKAAEDSLPAYAAQTTFFVLLSFFPFILLLVLIASRVPFVQNNVVTYVINVAPAQLRTYIQYLVDDLINSNSNSFTIITIIVSLWSAAKGFLALTYGLNRIYRVEKQKNYFIIRLFSALYTLIFMIACVLIMVIHVFGKQITYRVMDYWPMLSKATLLLYSLKNAFTFVILFFMFLALYYQLPGRKGHVRHEVTGAALAALAWMLMTRLFSLYIIKLAQDSYMYGNMTSFILSIIWLYFGMQIILYGAEINYFMSDFIQEYMDNHKRQKKDRKKKKKEKEEINI